jgi:hypothetical protein
MMNQADHKRSSVSMLFRDFKPMRMAGLIGMAVFGAGFLYAQPSVLTWHNDNGRSGQNPQETILTPANVNSSTFGKLFAIGVDGKVDGQPLYVPHLTIPSLGVHNVLYIATEHDTVYAVDADNGAILKTKTLLVGSETTSDVRNCASQVSPEIGVTSTPVIDPNMGPHGTIYVVAMSKLTSGVTAKYHQRLHALDLTTLAEEFGGPVDIQATYPGMGDEIANGMQTFMPAQHMDRAALLLANGIIYTTWSSHCDMYPYTSWVIGYNQSNLTQATVLNLVPNGSDGGIWSSGGGPQSDAAGNVYVPLGNGTFANSNVTTGKVAQLTGSGFPVNNNYGNAYVKMSSTNGQLAVADYFTMNNTVSESGVDTDLGSGGGMLLPPLNDFNGHSRNLAVAAGKDSNIYIMDTANLGKYNPSADEMYQQLTGVLGNGNSKGVWGSPAWFNGWLYYGAEGNPLRAFQFSNGRFGVNSSSQSTQVFDYPGTTPSISANGTSNGIVWAPIGTGTAVLHAYDATNLAHELYNTGQATGNRDGFGTGNKFVFPTIVNGKVYVASNGGTGIGTQPSSVAVFGLLASNTPPAVVSVSPNSGSGTSQVFTFTFSDTAGVSDIATALMDINATLVPGAACYLSYSRAVNTISLADDSGAWQSPLTVGTAGTSQNSQCVVNAGTSSASASGTTLTVSLALSFEPLFGGAKHIYAQVSNAALTSSWATLGTWTAGPPPPPPSAVSVTPNAGSGSTQTFAFAYTDSLGASDIAFAQMDISATLAVNGACYLYYVRGPNKIYLASDNGVWQGPIPMGVAGTLQNSQCTVDAGASSVLASGNNLTVSLAITFKPAYSGAKNIYTEVANGIVSAWTQLGTFTASSNSILSQPSAVSVTPNSGSGSPQTFMFAYTDPAGAADITLAQMDISATLAVNGACYLYYVPSLNEIYLASDTGVWQGPLPLGVAGTLQNSQCTVDAGASSALASGNNLTVSLAVSFKPAYSGAKNVYTEVGSSTRTTAWTQVGTWTVPSSGGSSEPSAVSLTITQGNGSSLNFAFVYMDPAGAADITLAQMDISSTLAVNGACYLYYVPSLNKIYLASDTGVWQGPIPLQVTGTLQNSQCTVDAGASSATAVGNFLDVNLSLSFQPAYSGAKNVYTEVGSNTVIVAWTQMVNFTIP